MTEIPRSEIEGLVEATLHAKGAATAKQLTEWLGLKEKKEVIAALGRLRKAGVVETKTGPAGALWFKMKKRQRQRPAETDQPKDDGSEFGE